MSYGVCIPSVATAAALAAAGRHITSSGFKISPPSAILAADAVFNRNGTSVAFIWAASEGGGGGDVHAAVARAAKAAATFRHVFLLAPAPAAADEAEVACGMPPNASALWLPPATDAGRLAVDMAVALTAVDGAARDAAQEQVTEAVSSPYVTVAALLSMPLGLTQADAKALVRLGSLLQLATLGARDITEDTELEPEIAQRVANFFAAACAGGGGQRDE